MNNNQNNNRKVIYQYNATTDSSVLPSNIPLTNNPNVKTVKPSTQKISFEPSLDRAKKALRLVNPFRGV